MALYEYIMKAVQDDARRASERDRLRLEARRARKARRQGLRDTQTPEGGIAYLTYQSVRDA